MVKRQFAQESDNGSLILLFLVARGKTEKEKTSLAFKLRMRTRGLRDGHRAVPQTPRLSAFSSRALASRRFWHGCLEKCGDHFGTFSKVLFPSLRLGYLVAPPELLDGLTATHRLIAVHLPLLEQMALADFIAEGYFARHLRRMSLLYKERRNALVDALTRALGKKLDVAVPEAGMHLVVWLPSGMSAQAVAQRAAASGLHILPISQFSPRSLPRDGLLLGFASVSPQELRAGVQTLALALQAH